MLVTAAKGIKDIQHNVQEFEKSINDDKIGLFEFLKGQENEWHIKLNRIFHSDNLSIYAETLADLSNENQGIHDHFVREIYKQVFANHLNELEISTLLNVNRELFQVNQSLLHAVKDVLLKDDRHISIIHQ